MVKNQNQNKKDSNIEKMEPSKPTINPSKNIKHFQNSEKSSEKPYSPSQQSKNLVNNRPIETKIEKEIVLNPDTAFLHNFEKKNSSRTHISSKEAQNTLHSHIIKKRSDQNIASVSKEKKVREKKIKHINNNNRSHQPQTTMVSNLNNASIEKKSNEGSEHSGRKLIISTKQTNNTLEYLIERFNQNRDPKLASYIAQSFYKKGNYEETVRWAILANSIDPSSEESWLLFAKAKVQLGQKQDAIKALRIYLNQYTSGKVKAYLHSLETGL
jgi:tetratricopeptide (TPR) repeat protein